MSEITMEFLEKRNFELRRELKKKDERLKELEITIKVLRNLNEREQHNG